MQNPFREGAPRNVQNPFRETPCGNFNKMSLGIVLQISPGHPPGIYRETPWELQNPLLADPYLRFPDRKVQSATPSKRAAKEEPNSARSKRGKKGDESGLAQAAANPEVIQAQRAQPWIKKILDEFDTAIKDHVSVPEFLGSLYPGPAEKKHMAEKLEQALPREEGVTYAKELVAGNHIARIWMLGWRKDAHDAIRFRAYLANASKTRQFVLAACTECHACHPP